MAWAVKTAGGWKSRWERAKEGEWFLGMWKVE